MNYLKIIFFCIIFFVLNINYSYSTEFMTGGSLTIAKGDTVNNDIITASKDLKLKGFINGDVISAGGSLTLNGEIKNDFIGAGRTIVIGGIIGDDIITVSENLTVDAEVESDIIAAGKQLEFSKRSVVNGNIYSAGKTIYIEGNVKGSVKCRAVDIIISGIIEKDADLSASGEIAFLTGARILGDLKYRAKKEILNLTEKNIVKGNIEFEEIKDQRDYFSGIKFLYEIWGFLAALIVGVIMILLLKRNIIETIIVIKNRSLLSFGVGIIVLLGVPILTLASMIFIITIPVGMIIIALYFIMMYVAKIYIGILLGNFLLKRQLDNEESFYFPLIVGLIVISIVSSLPYLDFFISYFISILGMGGVVIYLYSLCRERA